MRDLMSSPELCPICGNEMVVQDGVPVCPVSDDRAVLQHFRELQDANELLLRLTEMERQLGELERGLGARLGMADDLTRLREKVRAWRQKVDDVFQAEHQTRRDERRRSA